MRFLIDTHVFIWYTSDHPLLSARALEIIRDPLNQIFLSSASAWEMAIKIQIGKLALKRPLDDLLREHLHLNAIQELPIRMNHATAVGTLPPHHRDPFDRILVAQAKTEGMTVLSADVVLKKYDVDIVW